MTINLDNPQNVISAYVHFSKLFTSSCGVPNSALTDKYIDDVSAKFNAFVLETNAKRHRAATQSSERVELLSYMTWHRASEIINFDEFAEDAIQAIDLLQGKDPSNDSFKDAEPVASERAVQTPVKGQQNKTDADVRIPESPILSQGSEDVPGNQAQFQQEREKRLQEQRERESKEKDVANPPGVTEKTQDLKPQATSSEPAQVATKSSNRSPVITIDLDDEEDEEANNDQPMDKENREPKPDTAEKTPTNAVSRLKRSAVSPQPTVFSKRAKETSPEEPANLVEAATGKESPIPADTMTPGSETNETYDADGADDDGAGPTMEEEENEEEDEELVTTVIVAKPIADRITMFGPSPQDIEAEEAQERPGSGMQLAKVAKDNAQVGSEAEKILGRLWVRKWESVRDAHTDSPRRKRRRLVAGPPRHQLQITSGGRGTGTPGSVTKPPVSAPAPVPVPVSVSVSVPEAEPAEDAAAVTLLDKLLPGEKWPCLPRNLPQENRSELVKMSEAVTLL